MVSSEFSNYWPLFSLIIISLLGSLAITLGIQGSFEQWMHYFMGIFLLIFALLKIFQPQKFVEGFSLYDLIAKRVKIWGYIYPLIELFLGLAYLSFSFPFYTYWLTIIVMSIGAMGVFVSLKQGLKVNCACMGTVLNVPLSTVTLTEDLTMIVMAAVMLYLH